MAWKTEHKTLTRQRILGSAAKLFSLHGYELVGINEVMADAELTRGAFYSHFKSKSDLYAEAVISSANELTTLFSNAPTDDFVKSYLSTNHKEGEFARCPLAFMVTDITQRDKQVRDAYTKVFKGFVNRLVENKDHEQPLEIAEALQKAVILIGGVAISRAINDDELVAQLLKACQSGLLND